MSGPNRGRRLVRATLLGMLSLLAALLATSFYVELRYASRVVPLDRAPQAPVALVFGAGLAPGKEPSPVLAERLDTALALYRRGRVERLLFSGDNSDRYHDETGVMRRYTLARGLPEEAVLLDEQGLSTYDSCQRALSVFGIRRALLVTQDFHLPRALFLANSMGIDAYGVAADGGRKRHALYELRELFSRSLALVMVLIHPSPTPPPPDAPSAEP